MRVTIYKCNGSRTVVNCGHVFLGSGDLRMGDIQDVAHIVDGRQVIESLPPGDDKVIAQSDFVAFEVES